MRTAVILIASASLLTSPVLAADFYAERSDWVILKDDDDCSMWLEYEGPGSSTLGLIKGVDGTVAVSVGNDNWSVKDQENYDASLVLNGKEYGGAGAIGFKRSLGGGLVLNMGDGFERDFAKGSTLHVFLGEDRIDKLSLDGTANALVTLNQCVAKVRQEIAEQKAYEARYADLPRDPFAAAKPMGPREPVPVNRLWISGSDYRSSMIAARVEGRVAFRLAVNTAGRADSCEIAESSGNAELDELTCTLVSRRARFRPAIDEGGNEVPGVFEGSVNWTIPD
ncbi:TonB family protein [Erythrobacter sp. YJ-T3-07]|uniref:TonB family protein n=1 Tax=Erythrobacter sp. YJ-T3-07 TaxID=2793063 RepID=UPI0018D4CAD1|nr:TonB family protein [Erythrobacter sp. YJ-T3-07]MBH1944423.1 TonB family protein [Erythrobacter sp. YJ-T3-07]